MRRGIVIYPQNRRLRKRRSRRGFLVTPSETNRELKILFTKEL